MRVAQQRRHELELDGGHDVKYDEAKLIAQRGIAETMGLIIFGEVSFHPL